MVGCAVVIRWSKWFIPTRLCSYPISCLCLFLAVTGPNPVQHPINAALGVVEWTFTAPLVFFSPFIRSLLFVVVVVITDCRHRRRWPLQSILHWHTIASTTEEGGSDDGLIDPSLIAWNLVTLWPGTRPFVFFSAGRNIEKTGRYVNRTGPPTPPLTTTPHPSAFIQPK